MKEKFAQFLFDRIATKIAKAEGSASHEELLEHLDDVEDYLGTLKEIVMEVIQP